LKKFGIVANIEKKNAQDVITKLKDYISGKGYECKVIENKLQQNGDNIYYTNADEIEEGTDCIIVIGGDGTMIQAAKDLYDKGIPLYGINFGGVGFLAESEIYNMTENFDKLISGEYRVENRMMLEGNIYNGDDCVKEIALNDFAIFRREFGKLIRLEVYVNDTLSGVFVADGLIVSTPTGSTGYNISAGGPLLAPNVDAIAVTPICPHSLSDRSFVVCGSDKIEIKLLEGKNEKKDSAVVSVDGRNLKTISSGNNIVIRKSPVDSKIVLMQKTNFYQKMKNKLIRGGINESTQTK